MRPALDTPRGARYLSPALLPRPSSALVRVGPAPVTRCEPHRLGVAILRMITSRSLMRCLRGADEIHTRALASLPPLTPAAHAQRQVWCDRIFDAVEVLPASERVPVLLCVAYALHEHAPTGEVWADVARAIDGLHRGAESVEARAAEREGREVRAVIVEAHETIAARIAAEVLA